MPTYGYRCPSCTNEFDVFERMADEPNGHCPACGTRGVRQFFPTGIVFKGSGFYKTDSRSSSSGPPATTRTEKPATPPATGATGAPATTEGGTTAPARGGTAPAAEATSSSAPTD